MIGKAFHCACRIDSEAGTIRVLGYPFPHRRNLLLKAGDIREIINWFPPAICTHTDDLVLVSRAQIADLEALARQHEIPFVSRLDLWSLILDPFLDTEFDDNHYARTDAILADAGIGNDQLETLRAELKSGMLALTALTWEWQHYGLYDALAVMKPYAPWKRGPWRTFYDDAIRIALRSPVLPTTEMPNRKT